MAKQVRVPGTMTRQRTLYVLPEIRDDDTPAHKNALAIRNACTVEGRCPCCGTVGEITPDAEIAGFYHQTFRHEDWCAVLRDGDAA